MAWEEAQYTIDEVLAGIKTSTATSISGIPPKNMSSFLATHLGNGQISITCEAPSNTFIEGQNVCTVAGVRIVEKADSAPMNQEDGTTVGDVPVGEIFEGVRNVSTGPIYYYGFFPYSDHGVFNISPANVRKVDTSKNTPHFWAFVQAFHNLNPNTTISYPEGYENSNFDRMVTNEQSETTAGGWYSFLKDTLKNLPYMVDKFGRSDYQLNWADYTRKADGSNSDYDNLEYEGGAFAWINKIWMKEEHWSEGLNSAGKMTHFRKVTFADGPYTGFTPVGFYDTDGNELEGVWIPMGYMDNEGRTLVAGTQPLDDSDLNDGGLRRIESFKKRIEKFSSRGVFFGGPILNVLRDLMYMMFKTTNIQEAAGFGRCWREPYPDETGGYVSHYVIPNEVVPNGKVAGWKGTSLQSLKMNKMFHSQVLNSYQLWLVDPYILSQESQNPPSGGSTTSSAVVKMSPYYRYDAGGDSYETIHIDKSGGVSRDVYSAELSALDSAISFCGSIPVWNHFKDTDIGDGSSTTGLCDAYRLDPDISDSQDGYYALRLGGLNDDYDCGPAAIRFSFENDEAKIGHGGTVGVAVLLLPPPGYSPFISGS